MTNTDYSLMSSVIVSIGLGHTSISSFIGSFIGSFMTGDLPRVGYNCLLFILKIMDLQFQKSDLIPGKHTWAYTDSTGIVMFL